MSAIESRRRWAYRMIERCSAPPPAYGTPAWLGLPEGSVDKVAAVVIAAEAWARTGDTLEDDLHTEVAQLAAAFKRDEDADYQARAGAHREHWQQLAAPIPLRPRQGDATKPLEDIGRDYMAVRKDGGAA